jgi:hypothetical protein
MFSANIAFAQPPDDSQPPAPPPEAPPPPSQPTTTTTVQTNGGSVVTVATATERVPFARKGVLELGGAAGLRGSDNSTTIALTPQFGWFVWDNIQLSVLFDLTHISVDQGDNTTAFATIFEPSYHYQLSKDFYVFGGLGVGALWESQFDWGAALIPRAGVEIPIGRSGILTPAVSWTFSSDDDMQLADGIRINIGYSVIW